MRLTHAQKDELEAMGHEGRQVLVQILDELVKGHEQELLNCAAENKDSLIALRWKLEGARKLRHSAGQVLKVPS